MVAYCHVGQQATAVVLAARLLDIPVVLYDGAFQDWATTEPRRRRAVTRPTPIRISPAWASALVLLAAYALAGQGLGASGAFASVAAALTAAVVGTSEAARLARDRTVSAARVASPLRDWLVWELAGVATGALRVGVAGRPSGARDRARAARHAGVAHARGAWPVVP